MFILLLSFFLSLDERKQYVKANAYKYQILEIIDNGNSQLTFLNAEIYNVTTITMKKFINLQDDLIGKYDAIVLSKGAYNSQIDSKSVQAQDTTNMMTDITNLGATKIKKFAQAGYLVLFDRSSVMNQHSYQVSSTTSKQDGMLKMQFQSYTASSFFFYDTSNEESVILNNYFETKGKLRPVFSFLSDGVPEDYVGNASHVYKRGDVLHFRFQLLNLSSIQNKSYTAILYMDMDYNNQFTVNEQVVVKDITSIQDELTYSLPMGSSGTRFWKLEVMDNRSGFKSYQTGTFRVQDIPITIHALQVMGDTDTTKNRPSIHLSAANNYNIKIDTINMKQFNNMNTAIGEKYNMLLLGFSNYYNNSNMTSNALKRMKSFIATKQSVLNTNFSSSEQSSVINDLLHSYSSGNKAPSITLKFPADNSQVFSNQPIQLSYQVDDLDASDTVLTTRVFFGNVEVMTSQQVPNHTTVTKSFPPSLFTTGSLSITIEVWDSHNAKSNLCLGVKVVQAQSTMDVTRSINQTLVQVGKQAIMSYVVKPKDILASDITAVLGNVSSFDIKNIQWSDSIPSGIQAIPKNDIFPMTLQGNQISGTLPTITYRRNGNYFQATAITFTLPIIPTAKNVFTLKDATITYKDYTGNNTTDTFNSLTLESDNGITNMTFPSVFYIRPGDSKNLVPYVTISPNNNVSIQMTWSQLDGGDAVSLDNTGIITGLKAGTSHISVSVTDRFGNQIQAPATIYVQQPVNSIVVQDITLYEGEEKSFSINVNPSDGYSGVTVTNTAPSIAQFDKDTKKVRGVKAGTTTLTFQGTSADGSIVTANATITVLSSVVTVAPKNIELFIGESTKWSASTQPSSLSYSYGNYDSSIIQVTNDTITALTPGITTITVVASAGSGRDTILTKVWNMVPNGVVIIPKGREVSLSDIIQKNIIFLGYTPAFTTYYPQKIGDTTYIEYVPSTQSILGKRIGQTTLTLSFVHPNGKNYSILLTISVKNDTSYPSSTMLSWY